MEEGEEFSPEDLSIVVPYGEYSGKCGYCKNPKGSCSYGMEGVRLRVQDYQDLIDKGWRRSGTWLYKPNNNESCCTYYTIRLDVNKFHAGKGQKKTSKKWEKYLATGEHKASKTEPGDADAEHNEGGEHMEVAPNEVLSLPSTALSSIGVNNPKRTFETPTTRPIAIATTTSSSSSSSSNSLTPNEKTAPTVKSTKTSNTPHRSTAGPINKEIVEKFGEKLIRTIKAASDSGKIPLRDAMSESTTTTTTVDEFLRLSLNITANPVVSRKKRGDYSSNIALRIAGQKSWREKHPTLHAPEVAKIIVEQFSTPLENDPLPPERWRVEVSKAPPGFINLIDLQLGDVHLSEVKKPKEKKPSQKEKTSSVPTTKRLKIDTNPKHKFEIQTVQSRFDEECYQVYRNYQMTIHKDKPEKITVDSYTNFLVTSPLMYEAHKEGVPPCGFGSFHQIYRLDGKVVAVGVVDILPSCLSGVYFYYDPDFQFLSLGKISALKEIEWVHENQKYSMNMHYYYMGYYIHTCQKMRYKGTYRPSDLLCPHTHKWVPLDPIVPKIEAHKNPRLVDDDSIPTVNEVVNSKKSEIAKKVPIVNHNQLYFLGDLTERSKSIVEKKLSPYIDRVGNVASRMLCIFK